ncbi:two-component system sensor histidine kinase TctE [Acidovorax sp. 69]|uniref:sensor histidine kinase n=1 Tax=Acidovorax sp. 69 TaxID=2035202 RepID=UPI000C24158E|nr:sensor histidine kinase [Acidovorax sp. 69]PJI97901.1 two-component system sensor histidine kinase TctE [Acidovorax sp. 69]
MPAGPDAGLTARQRPPALRQRIGRHVLLSLVLIWALGSAVVLGVGNHFVTEAFDRALLDDAHALAAHVRSGDSDPLRLDLTPREVGLLRFDQSETVWFAVYGPDGAFVAGDRDVATASVATGAAHEFSNLARDGRELRRVSLHIDGPPTFTVVMAQTTAERTHLLRRLLVYSGLAQLWLLVVLGSRLLRGIERDLRPLTDLQDAMDRRDAADLQPLPEALTRQAGTRDVQHLGEALDGLLARVQQSLHAQREFAGNVAHELRTPLAGIRAQAAHALAHNDPSVWRSELEGIAQAEQRASRTVDQLLALARAAEGGIALTLQTMALDTLVRDIVLRFVPRADALSVDLGAEGLDKTVEVHGNAALIEGILNNLLDNALRYGRGSPPCITVALHTTQDHAVLTVTDNGPGIDSALAEHLHQRWAQGEQGLRLGQGAGLGLSIVARYAELLGGRLALANAEGSTAHSPHGLVASVWLPLARPVVSDPVLVA